MIQRFQIEDLVIQDASGVVFRALDTQSNQTVAVRRFFPFGAHGGGLHEEEQTAYAIAVERLTAITHPALRAVIAGGCDPVDGMPFIATEWIDGPRLEAFVELGPLDPAEAANLLSQALEVCELLSEVLAEEAVWVETSLQAIVVGAEGSGRGVTFWIAPLKWLGKNDVRPGLDSIITLTEEIMGWTGKAVDDQAGRGLGGWLNWLRGKSLTATLRETREMLATAVGAEPLTPVRKLVAQSTRPLVAGGKKRMSRLPLVLGAAVPLLAISLGGYFLIKRNNALNAANAALYVENHLSDLESDQLYIPQTESVLGAEPDIAAPPSPQISEDAKNARLLEIQKRGDRFEVRDRELLLGRKNTEVQLTGRLAEVRFSDKGKGPTLYLEFSKPAAKDEPRGYIMRKNLTKASLRSLQSLIGKQVSLRGKVQTPTSPSHPEIEIKNLASIQEVK